MARFVSCSSLTLVVSSVLLNLSSHIIYMNFNAEDVPSPTVNTVQHRPVRHTL